VQYLDLSQVADGVIRRDDRLGYLKLATDPKLQPRDFIRCSSWEGKRRVQFYVENNFNLTTGAPIPDEDWSPHASRPCGARIHDDQWGQIT
jgi:hypothetical protein